MIKRLENYKRVILANAGTLNIIGGPGTGKSASIEAITTDLGYQFIDFRLTQIGDAGEILGIPNKFEVTDEAGHKHTVMTYCIPEWAWMANQKPTIIFFDEMNRADASIRNSALQLLNERRIGYKFKFNKDVHFVVAGNLGDGDGTEVESFDNALKGRLVTMVHDMSYKEWKESFAEANLNPLILKFLEAHESFINKLPENNDDLAYPSFRSWTNFSKFCGKNATASKMLDDVKDFGDAFVGGEATNRLKNYLINIQRVTAKDVIKNWDKVKDIVLTMEHVVYNEILNDIKATDFTTYTKKEVENIMGFLKVVHEDQRTGFLNYILQEYYVKKAPADKKIDNFKLLKNDEVIKEDLKVIMESADEIDKIEKKASAPKKEAKK